MKPWSILALAAALAAGSGAAAARPPRGAVGVGPGVYRPMFPARADEAEIAVPAFWLDREPVTNRQFLAFVTAHPAWRRDQVKRLFADAEYLAHWAGPAELGDTAPARAPVVRVSWFAARAYCAARGGRLPDEREWELAAAASPDARDASRDPAWSAQMLAWYAQPTPDVLPAIGGEANAWGVRDLHGLVWEWIEDFAGALVAPDDRGGATRDMFCGGGGARAADPTAYAAFLRIAFRSSLEARFTTLNLGFRCAYDRAAPGPDR